MQRLDRAASSLKVRLFLLSVTLTGVLFGLQGCAGLTSVDQNIQQESGITGAISKQFFGLHVNNLYTETAWPQMSFGSLRLWDAGVTWHDLEPEAGLWNFGRLDRILRDAELHQVEPVLVLGMTPTWASARPSENSPYGMGAAAPPKDIAAWRDYVRTVGERYKGRIRYWELWNEPNYSQYYTGSMAELLSLSKEAYLILKEIDPGNQVIAPASNSGKWLGAYLRDGGGDYADIIGYHFYHFPGTPEDLVPYFRGIKGMLSDLGFSSKPLWNTEMGWGKGDGPDQTFPDEKEAAAYVVRTMLLSWSEGISRVQWYAWNNRSWVQLYLTEADHSTPTLAAKAYGELQDWLMGATMTPCVQAADLTFSCQLISRTGANELIVWNPSRTTSFQIPDGNTVTSWTDIQGSIHAVSARSIEVGPSPTLLSDSR